jgi:broad specificity phosphatase PhoE
VLVHFLTHPDVAIDPAVPVPEWGLSERGRDRAQAFASRFAGSGRIAAVYSSPEVKAEQTAHPIGDAAGLAVTLVGGLAEIDRAATGYLSEPDFWANYRDFLAVPTQSARGWETADTAQRRIVATVEALIAEASQTSGETDIVIVSHGGVGALLMAQLTGTPIQRLVDQPGQGSYFRINAGHGGPVIQQGWQSLEQAVESLAE